MIDSVAAALNVPRTRIGVMRALNPHVAVSAEV
jgi:hypothetical protein